MQINGLNLSLVLHTGELPKELGLKDGQSIVGKMICAFQNEAVLQLAGRLVQARLDGPALAPGTLVLFRVALTQEQTIELKVLSRLTGAQPENPPPALNQPSGVEAPVLKAMQEFGLTASTRNLTAVGAKLQLLEEQYQCAFPPQVVVFLLKHQLPVTPGTLLFSWLYQDQELRNWLWNRLRNSSAVNRNPTLLPPVIELADQPAAPGGQITVLAQQPDGGTAQSSESPLAEQLTEAEAGQLKSLLEQSANLERAVTAGSPDGRETVIPLLVGTAANLVEEYRLKWKEKATGQDDPPKEEWLRLTIPTANLGEINLTVQVSAGRVRIGFKVGSGAVRDYLNQYLTELRQMVGENTQIAVSLNEAANKTDSRFDRWI